jgi:hypothetical protein
MNRSRWRLYIWGVLLFGALLSVVPAAWAQGGPAYTLDWWTIDAGGTTSGGGGGYTLSGTSGQPDTTSWAGGGYTLNGGFWLEAAANSGTAVTLYLPVIIKNYIYGPDLVIDSLSSDATGPQVVIRNAGNAPVTDAFWVDVYFDPTTTPSLNQPWDSLAPAGAAWGITADLPAGDTLTLTVGDAYYFPQYSSAGFPADVPVYGYVDSVNYATGYGNVWESDEGNNLFGPIDATAGSDGAPTTENEADKMTDWAALPTR